MSLLVSEPGSRTELSLQTRALRGEAVGDRLSAERRLFSGGETDFSRLELQVRFTDAAAQKRQSDSQL